MVKTRKIMVTNAERQQTALVVRPTLSSIAAEVITTEAAVDGAAADVATTIGAAPAVPAATTLPDDPPPPPPHEQARKARAPRQAQARAPYRVASCSARDAMASADAADYDQTSAAEAMAGGPASDGADADGAATEGAAADFNLEEELSGLVVQPRR